MPAFIDDTASISRLTHLTFTQGYIEALFFTELSTWARDEWDERADSKEIPFDFGFSDLSETALASIEKDCASFQEQFADLLNQAYETKAKYVIGNVYTPKQAGHDFWLTRNHHGAGFWDRGLGKIGDRLAEVAHSYGEIDVFLGDDDKIYLS